MSTRTLASRRTTGIEPRHARSCTAKSWDEAGVCACSPTFQASVYIARDGKLVRKTFPTIAAAKSWRADSTHAIKRGTMSVPTKQSISDGLDAMLAGMKAGSVRNRNRKPFKPSAIRSYEAAVVARLRPMFGARKLTDLQRNDVQDYAEELLAEGLDPSTVRNLLMPLRVLYRIAVRRGEVAVNPTHDLELPEHVQEGVSRS